jgi:type II secretory pathway pseudopilin PulG
MGTLSRNRGITLVEVLTVIGILLILVLIISASIPRSHEQARRANCMNNMKQIGLALLNYENQQKFFPGSAEVIKSDPQRPVGGWSFLFKLLPNMEYDAIYSSFSPALLKGTITSPPTCIPLVTTGDSSSPNCLIIARDTGIAEFLCPSNPNPGFTFPSGPPNMGKRHAVTNYKAMSSAFYPGFTTNTGTTQQYTGEVAIPEGSYPGLYRCDGGLFPTNDGIRQSDISDGTSHTIFCAETMDVFASSWLAGSDVNMVAIPDATPQIAKGATPFMFKDTSGSSFFALPGFNGKFDSRGGTQKIVTFFSLEFGYEFSPRDSKGDGIVPCKDVNTYPLDPYQSPCQLAPSRPMSSPNWRYGPSSGHPSVINCLFGDGSVRPVRKDVDAAALFFAVTRANGDPPADDQL